MLQQFALWTENATEQERLGTAHPNEPFGKAFALADIADFGRLPSALLAERLPTLVAGTFLPAGPIVPDTISGFDMRASLGIRVGRSLFDPANWRIAPRDRFSSQLARRLDVGHCRHRDWCRPHLAANNLADQRSTIGSLANDVSVDGDSAVVLDCGRLVCGVLRGVRLSRFRHLRVGGPRHEQVEGRLLGVLFVRHDPRCVRGDRLSLSVPGGAGILGDIPLARQPHAGYLHSCDFRRIGRGCCLIPKATPFTPTNLCWAPRHSRCLGPVS